MELLKTPAEARAFSRGAKARGKRVALVPTMGYLHEGHLSLVRLARQNAGAVMVSLFINPKQFGPGEDLDRYPRDFERDRSLCEREAVTALYAPDAAHVYPPGFCTSVEVAGSLSAGLCGASRPGHFRGVATVVTKLLCTCEPDLAVFGQKDAQQAAVVRRLVRDLDLPVEILVAPIVREADGLAMSSRNVYLSPEERAQAPALKAALDEASALFARGERRAERLIEAARGRLMEAPLARIDYVELVDADKLQPVAIVDRPSLLALAVFFGATRLIDNAHLTP
jgi:pantoate--beta-alanine ligase